MERYDILIYEKYKELLNSNKTEFSNNELFRIFEYYSCIKLSQEYNKPFYVYNDIDPTFKEINKMSHNDTGIDLCDLDNTIVQCKLRKSSLTWKECSTFFASRDIYSEELNKIIIRWDNLIITRNDDCILSHNLLDKKELFIDRTFSKKELLNYCDNLIKNPPKYPEINNDFQLRDYQLECIDIINKNKNVIINLPTGTGKNSVIIYSLKGNVLILVPRIILMDQLKEEIIKHKPKYKNKIQLIGDSNNEFNKDKLITICVYNSVHIVKDYEFDRIYVDEAHHINKPEIYSELDDSEESNTYIDIIRDFSKLNNNVYLSATIDECDGFTYYKKDIREMIELGYLCDYNINVPIFTNDPTNKNICKYLVDNYRNIIIYCNSQEEGIKINKLMNEILSNCSEYIDCNTSNKKRNNIINKYKNGNLSFLVNVQVLVEGFDSANTCGVCFMHLPSNGVKIIQTIGRALRLHPTKKIANVILPYSNDDDKSINSFLRVMANNDSRIRKSYEGKRLGGYINIDNIDIEDDETIEFKYNMVYNSMGVLLNGEEIWYKKLKEVEKYIDENGKRPSRSSKNVIVKKLGFWLDNQNSRYKIKKDIMKNDNVRKTFEIFLKKYKEYFLSIEEEWYSNLNLLKNYMDKYNKRPTESDKDESYSKIGRWINTQRHNYINKEKSMENKNIREKYEQFIKEYERFFISNEDIWKSKLKLCIDYIEKYNKAPLTYSKDNETRYLANWIHDQNYSYKNNKYIMKNITIKKLYEDFINKYKIHLLNNIETWKYKLNKLEIYIKENNKLPSKNDNNIEIKSLNNFLCIQKQNYKNNRDIMKNEEFRKIYEEFVNKYEEYLLSNEDIWKNKLKLLQEYINKNNRLPKCNDTNNLAEWLTRQKRAYRENKYIMKDEEIRKLYEDFVKQNQQLF